MRSPEQQRAERAAIAHGIDTAARGPAEVVVLMRVLHDEVRRAVAERSVAPLMTFLYANMAATEARMRHVAVACRAGCSHCCNGFVAATTPEVLFVARAVTAQTAAAIARAAAATRDKSPDQRERMVTPCPLLADNRCTVYDVRPLACRTEVSTDAEACRRAHIALSGEPLPRPIVYSAFRRAYYVALAGALRRAGLAFKAYEYNSALAHVLASPAAEASFLAGDDILAGLPEDIGPGVFADPVIEQVYQAAFA
jgi:Fe-S-cluster containining protein